MTFRDKLTETITSSLFMARAMKFTRNRPDAQDLLQTTALKALEHEDQYIEQDNFDGWLYCIMRNAFLSTVRPHAFNITRKAEELTELNGPIVVAPQETQVMVSEVRAAMKKLPDWQAEVIELKAEGLRYKEMETVCEVPESTVKSRLWRARRQLEQFLGA